MERLFTPDEANEALATVRPLAERMVERHAALVAAERSLRALQARLQGNGHGSGRAQADELEATVRREAAAVAGCVAELRDLGVQVKDAAAGLLDFPALAGGEVVLLCWRVGEPEVAWWHSLDGGFAGRRPLPF